MNYIFRVLIFILVFAVPRGVYASMLCADIVQTGQQALSTARQMGLSDALVSRYANDPYVLNAAYEMIGRNDVQGTLGSVNYKLIVSKKNTVEPSVEIYSLSRTNLKIGQRVPEFNLDMAKLYVALKMATDIMFDGEAKRVQIIYSSFLNEALFDQMFHRLKDNPSLKNFETYSGKNLRFFVERPN